MRAYGDLTAEQRTELDTGGSTEGNSALRKRNPSAQDWMLRITVEEEWTDSKTGETHTQPPLSEGALAEAFGDWSWVGQLERGSQTGRDHYQLLMRAASKIRLSSILRRFGKAGIHVGYIAPRHASLASCYKYVTKNDTRVAGPYVHGDADFTAENRQGQRQDLMDLREAVKQGMTVSEILRDDELTTVASRNLPWLEKTYGAYQSERFGMEDREVKVHYLWGRPGVGKTRKVMSDHDRKDIFRVSNYEHPFDDYEGQPVLVLDEFNSQLQFQLMLNILDRYPCKLPCRYRDAWAGWTEVWIVSNKSLPQQYEGVDEQIRPALDRRISEVLKMLGDGSTVSQDDIEKTEDDEWGFL